MPPRQTVHAAARAVVEHRDSPDLPGKIDALSRALTRDSKGRAARGSSDKGGRPPIDATPVLKALRAGKTIAQIVAEGIASEATAYRIKRAAGL